MTPLRMALPQRTRSTSLKEVAVVEHELPASTPAERSWAAVWERNFPGALRSATRLLGKDAAYDAVQDKLLELLSEWPKLTPEERTDAYVRQAIRRHVIDEYRRQEKLVEYTHKLEVSGAVPVLAAPETPSDFAVAADKVISAMPPQRREMCILVYEYGLTIREASEELGIAFETARTHMKLAHVWLRKHMPKPAKGYRLNSGDLPRQLPPSTEAPSEDAPNE